jgi:tRNA pseudouridine38-40 synthase
VSNKFHSRYDAKKKEYIYQCTLDNNPLLKSNYWFVKNIDLDILNDISEKLCGNHNFLSFSKFNPEKENTMCEIFVSKWILEDKKLLYITEGNRFLHHMVRYLVGVMIEVSRNHILSIKDFKSMINGVKRKTIFRAPAQGLYLKEIFYE